MKEYGVEIPLLEGCRGGLFRREDPPLKAKAFFPLQKGEWPWWQLEQSRLLSSLCSDSFSHLDSK